MHLGADLEGPLSGGSRLSTPLPELFLSPYYVADPGPMPGCPLPGDHEAWQPHLTRPETRALELGGGMPHPHWGPGRSPLEQESDDVRQGVVIARREGMTAGP